MDAHRQGRLAVRAVLPVIGLVLVCAGSASAMREVGGKDPVADGLWPDGVLAVANQPARFAFTQGFIGAFALRDVNTNTRHAPGRAIGMINGVS